jgi:hypothetical protein
MRAKFFAESITTHAGGGKTIKARPVTGDSEENKSFWKYTPSGSLEMFVDIPQAEQFFAAGQEYYIDFTPVLPSGDS